MSAATDHLESVAKRLALFNRQTSEAEEQLDRLTARLADEGDAEGQPGEQRDVTILGSSLPGVGRIVSALQGFPCLCEQRGEPTKPCPACPASHPPRGARANRQAADTRLHKPSITGPRRRPTRPDQPRPLCGPPSRGSQPGQSPPLHCRLSHRDRLRDAGGRHLLRPEPHHPRWESTRENRRPYTRSS